MSAISAQPHETECAVCTNDFTTPKILPCGHLLCKKCVISWIDTRSDAGCPLCRCPLVEPRDQLNQSSADVADALPTDFVMEALVESVRVLAKERICCVCDDVTADFICMQCMDMMCSSCAKIHKKMSMSRSHDVESLSTVTPERLAASLPALCADHGDKQSLFCVQHGLALCLSCSFLKHRECTQVKELHDQMRTADSSLGDLIDTLGNAEQRLEQALRQLNSRLQEVDAGEKADMAQVDKIFDYLLQSMEVCRNQVKERTRGIHSKARASLHDVKAALENRFGKMTSHKRIVTRARAVAPRPALIHVTQALIDRVNSLDLTADLTGHVLANPVPSAKWCEEVVMRVVQDLKRLGHQTTESWQNNASPVVDTESMSPSSSSRSDHTSRDKGSCPVGDVQKCKRVVVGQRVSINEGILMGYTGYVLDIKNNEATVKLDSLQTAMTFNKSFLTTLTHLKC